MTDWHDAEEHVDKAHELFEAGNWREAERLLRRALSLHPDRAEWHFNLGLTLEAAGEYAKAARAFADAATHNPGEAVAHVASAVNHLRADDPSQALPHLARARTLAPERVDVLVHSIEALARTGDHDEAEVMFYRAIHLDADHADAYANMGESLVERELWARAASCFESARRLQPSMPKLAARLALCRHRLGEPEKARRLYLRELRENPGDTGTLMDLGDLLADMGRLESASEMYRRVLQLNPRAADAHFALAGLASRRGNHRLAVRRLRRVLRLEPDYPQARRRLARVRLDMQQPDRARRLLQRELGTLRADPSSFSPDDLRDLGTLLMDASEFRPAAGVFALLCRKAPRDALAHHFLGCACLTIGRVRRGVREELAARRLDRSLVAAWYNLALAMIDRGRWRRSAACLARARALAPGDPQVRRLSRTFALRRVCAWLARAGLLQDWRSARTPTGRHRAPARD